MKVKERFEKYVAQFCESNNIKLTIEQFETAKQDLIDWELDENEQMDYDTFHERMIIRL